MLTLPVFVHFATFHWIAIKTVVCIAAGLVTAITWPVLLGQRHMPIGLCGLSTLVIAGLFFIYLSEYSIAQSFFTSGDTFFPIVFAGLVILVINVLFFVAMRDVVTQSDPRRKMLSKLMSENGQLKKSNAAKRQQIDSATFTKP